MDIREIRLDHFGCWEGVQIRSLTPGLNVIHLDHAGRPIDFSRFLFGQLFGFEEKLGRIHAGRITFARGDERWTLDRRAGRDGEQSWGVKINGEEPVDQLQALKEIQSSAKTTAAKLFLPTDSETTEQELNADRWHWLARNPQVLGELLNSRSPRSENSFLRNSSVLSLAPHGTVLERLGKEREALVTAIAQCRANLVEERNEQERRDAAHAERSQDFVERTVVREAIIPIRTEHAEGIERRVEELNEKTARAARIEERTFEDELAVNVERRTSKRRTSETIHPPDFDREQLERNLLADLRDELRSLRLKIVPMRAAVDVSEQWEELQTLRKRAARSVDASDPTLTADKLRSMLSTFQMLEEEKRDYRKSLGSQSRPKAKKKDSDERVVRRLLDQRDWVSEAVDRSVVPLEVSAEHHAEIRHAGSLFETARSEAERADRRMHEFARRKNFDWSTLLVEHVAPTTSEISIDSPIAQESPNRQLAELKRRRLWVREEYRSLLEGQVFLPQMLVWLVILFVLSIASLFGTLVVTSLVAQWVLLAFGIGGIVSSFALRMSIELRSSRTFNRTRDRLQQIDGEILALTERVLDQRQDAASSRRKAEERLYALQIQQDASEANRRLDSAERSFREALDVHGLPLTLSPTEAARTLARRERTLDSDPTRVQGHAKLRTWIKRARDTIQRIDGVRPGKDPHALLANLESLFDHFRDQVHADSTSSRKTKSYDRELREDARKQIRRIEKRQQSILRKARVEDQFGFEAMVEAAVGRSRSKKRIRRLESVLKSTLSMHDDPEEVRDLLEAYDAASLRTLLAESKSRKSEVEREIAQRESQPKTPTPLPEKRNVEPVVVERIEPQVVERVVVREPVVPPVQELPRPTSVYQVELDRLRLQLAVVETQIRRSMKSAQAAAILRSTSRTLLQEDDATEQPFPFLSELTEGRWQTLQTSSAGITISGKAGDQVFASNCADSSLAWLAVQLAAGMNRNSFSGALPICLLADRLLDSPDADRIFSALSRAGAAGVQCLLLASDRQLVNQLGEAGSPIVRVALREDTSLRIAEVPKQNSVGEHPDVNVRRIASN